MAWNPAKTQLANKGTYNGVARHNLNLTRLKCEGQVVFNYFSIVRSDGGQLGVKKG